MKYVLETVRWKTFILFASITFRKLVIWSSIRTNGLVILLQILLLFSSFLVASKVSSLQHKVIMTKHSKCPSRSCWYQVKKRSGGGIKEAPAESWFAPGNRPPPPLPLLLLLLLILSKVRRKWEENICFWPKDIRFTSCKYSASKHHRDNFQSRWKWEHLNGAVSDIVKVRSKSDLGNPKISGAFFKMLPSYETISISSLETIAKSNSDRDFQKRTSRVVSGSTGPKLFALELLTTQSVPSYCIHLKLW